MHRPRLHGAPLGWTGALLQAEIVLLALKLQPVQSDVFAVVSIGFRAASLDRHSSLAALVIVDRLPELGYTLHCCQLSLTLHSRRNTLFLCGGLSSESNAYGNGQPRKALLDAPVSVVPQIPDAELHRGNRLIVKRDCFVLLHGCQQSKGTVHSSRCSGRLDLHSFGDLVLIAGCETPLCPAPPHF